LAPAREARLPASVPAVPCSQPRREIAIRGPGVLLVGSGPDAVTFAAEGGRGEDIPETSRGRLRDQQTPMDGIGREGWSTTATEG